MTNKRVSRREFLKIGGTGLAGDVSPEQAVKTLQSELEQIVEQGQQA
jgi:hypothetical protein